MARIVQMLNDEQAAYDKAEWNAARAACLRAAVDYKVAVENARRTGIMDWGNVRTQDVCIAPTEELSARAELMRDVAG